MWTAWTGGQPQEQLDRLIGAVRASYRPAQWSYYAADMTALDKAIRGEEAPAAAAGAPPPEAQSTTDAMAAIAELMKMQAGMTGSLGTIAEANPLNFASVEIQVPDGAAAAPTNGNGTNGSNGADGGNGAHAEQAAANGDGAVVPATPEKA